MSQLIFKNYGGSYQIRIIDAGDLAKIQTLDEAHWAATSVPISSLNCDPSFLAFMDTDKNGRIRTDEVKDAQAWLFRFLTNRGALSKGIDVLRLEDIDISHPEGQKLRKAAERILINLNSQNMSEINLAQVRDVQNIKNSSANNGDGIIPPDATSDTDLAGFISSVAEAIGSTSDANGKPGISQSHLEEFIRETESYLNWRAKGEVSKSSSVNGVMPWGEDTLNAYELVSGLTDKIEQYFMQCAMAKFDERTISKMRFHQDDIEKMDYTDRVVMENGLKSAPLAVPYADSVLDFEKMTNPYYCGRLFNLRENVLKRIFGKSIKTLTQKQWEEVKGIFTPYRAWLDSKKGAKVEKLGVDLLRTYLKGPYRQKVSKLITEDMAVADELNQIHNVEKLILYQRWLMEFANNFVSFANLYDPKKRSLFETGILVMDGKQFTFTMKVQDRQAHKKIAEESCMYLMYLEITGHKDKNVKFEIVTPVTSGSQGRLHVGKRGVFFTSDGQEWDAEVVNILINPINPWESLKAPFQQFMGFVKKQVSKFTESNQAKLERGTSGSSSSGITRDLLLGGGIAIAALGSAFAYITKALSQVKPIHVLLTLVGLAGFIILPAIIVGLTKIRKRNLSVLLEAAGWAVNAHMRMNNTLGKLFTHTPRIPKGAYRERKDALIGLVKEFGYRPLRSRKTVFAVLIIILTVLGIILACDAYPGFKNLILTVIGIRD